VVVQSESGCLCIALGENQWVFDEFDLHNISSSQTHRDKVLNLLVTRVVEQHPTYFLHLPGWVSRAGKRRGLGFVLYQRSDPRKVAYSVDLDLSTRSEMQKLQSGNLGQAKILGQVLEGRILSGNSKERAARDDNGNYALVKLFMRMSPRHWTRGEKIP
jgi:hypothetical protein